MRAREVIRRTCVPILEVFDDDHDHMIRLRAQCTCVPILEVVDDDHDHDHMIRLPAQCTCMWLGNGNCSPWIHHHY